MSRRNLKPEDRERIKELEHEIRQILGRAVAEDPSIIEHGRVSAYEQWGCRCEACLAAVRQKSGAMARADYDKKRAASHGTLTMYQKGCRCPSCKEAVTAYNAEWRKKRHPDGSRKRKVSTKKQGSRAAMSKKEAREKAARPDDLEKRMAARREQRRAEARERKYDRMDGV